MNCGFTDACVDKFYENMQKDHPGAIIQRNKSGGVKLSHPIKMVVEEGAKVLVNDLKIKNICQTNNAAACGGDHGKAWLPK